MLQLLDCLAFCFARRQLHRACLWVCTCASVCGTWRGASGGCCSLCFTLQRSQQGFFWSWMYGWSLCAEQVFSWAGGCTCRAPSAAGREGGRHGCVEGRCCPGFGSRGLGCTLLPLGPGVSKSIWTRDLASRNALPCSALDLKLAVVSVLCPCSPRPSLSLSSLTSQHRHRRLLPGCALEHTCLSIKEKYNNKNSLWQLHKYMLF